MKQLAPIALFTYKRLENLKLEVESLRQDILAPRTELHVFSDAPRKPEDIPQVEAVRAYLKTVVGFKTVRIVERPENLYIERNIMSGVEEMFRSHERLIVMEDDVAVGRQFLTFMNNVLDFYDGREQVMHISPWTFIKMPRRRRQAIVWRYMECTGCWATWRSRWSKFKYLSKPDALALLSPAEIDAIQMGGDFKCLASLDLNPIPWDICWYIAIFKAGGVTINPPWSLVENTGLFSGEHFGSENLLRTSPFETEITDDAEVVFPTDLTVDVEAERLIKAFFGRSNRTVFFRVGLKLLLVVKKAFRLAAKRLKRGGHA